MGFKTAAVAPNSFAAIAWAFVSRSRRGRPMECWEYGEGSPVCRGGSQARGNRFSCRRRAGRAHRADLEVLANPFEFFRPQLAVDVIVEQPEGLGAGIGVERRHGVPDGAAEASVRVRAVPARGCLPRCQAARFEV